MLRRADEAPLALRWIALCRWRGWIDTKLPFLTAAAVLLDPGLSAPDTLSIMGTIAAAAAFGYAANEVADRAGDARAGRPNRAAGLPPVAWGAFLALSAALALGLSAIWAADAAGPALVAVSMGLACAYSFPPLRLKERGWAGVVGVAVAQWGIPVLAVASAEAGGWAEPEAWSLSLLGVALGVRWIAVHQLLDAATDRRAGVRTLAATGRDVSRVLGPALACEVVLLALVLALTWSRSLPAAVALGTWIALTLVVRQRRPPLRTRLASYRNAPLAGYYFLLMPVALAIGLYSSLEWVLIALLLLALGLPSFSWLLPSIGRNGAPQAAQPSRAGARQPPGPMLPRRIQAIALDYAPLRFMETCRRMYGDVVMLRGVPEPRLLMVFDPELSKQVLRRSSEAGLAITARLRGIVGEQSIVAMEGAQHRHRRRVLSPAFHGTALSALSPAIHDAADRMINRWPTGEEFALLPSLQELVVEVIAANVLSIEQGPRGEEFLRRVREFLFDTYSTSPRRQTPPDRRPVEALLREEIAQRRSESRGDGDVLSLLLQARDGGGEPINERELCDQLMTLLIAGGLMTTAPSLAWGFELVFRHPGAHARLEDALANDEDDYLEAVIKETLRLHPPVQYVARVVKGEPLTLGGYTIPAGTEIRMSIAAIHHRPDLHPEPFAFRPERFMGTTGSDGFWSPFGWAPHSCLGGSLAMLEMQTVMRRVLERTHLRLAERRSEKLLPGKGSPQRVRVVNERRVPARALS